MKQSHKTATEVLLHNKYAASLRCSISHVKCHNEQLEIKLKLSCARSDQNDINMIREIFQGDRSCDSVSTESKITNGGRCDKCDNMCQIKETSITIALIAKKNICSCVPDVMSSTESVNIGKDFGFDNTDVVEKFPNCTKENIMETKCDESSDQVTCSVNAPCRDETMKSLDHDIHNQCVASCPASAGLRSHVNSDKDRSHCEQTFSCKQQFSDQLRTKKHVNIHKGEKKHKCSSCTKFFSSRKELDSHVSTRSCEKRQTCDICGRSFTALSSLKTHRLLHSKDRPFVCQVCGKKYAAEILLRKHSRLHNTNNPFVCECCGKSFAILHYLQSHMKTHLGYKKQECRVCGKSYRDAKYLKIHMKTHTGEGLLKCDLCGENFADPSYLRVHRKRFCNGIKVTCTDCGKTFSRSADLKSHVGVHAGTHPFECSTCGKGFVKQSALSIHVRRHNENIKKSECTLCSKRFLCQSDLRKHVLSHTRKKRRLGLPDKLRYGTKELNANQLQSIEDTNALNGVEVMKSEKNIEVSSTLPNVTTKNLHTSDEYRKYPNTITSKVTEPTESGVGLSSVNMKPTTPIILSFPSVSGVHLQTSRSLLASKLSSKTKLPLKSVLSSGGIAKKSMETTPTVSSVPLASSSVTSSTSTTGTGCDVKTSISSQPSTVSSPRETSISSKPSTVSSSRETSISSKPSTVSSSRETSISSKPSTVSSSRETSISSKPSTVSSPRNTSSSPVSSITLLAPFTLPSTSAPIITAASTVLPLTPLLKTTADSTVMSPGLRLTVGSLTSSVSSISTTESLKSSMMSFKSPKTVSQGNQEPDLEVAARLTLPSQVYSVHHEITQQPGSSSQLLTGEPMYNTLDNEKGSQVISGPLEQESNLRMTCSELKESKIILIPDETDDSSNLAVLHPILPSAVEAKMSLDLTPAEQGHISDMTTQSTHEAYPGNNSEMSIPVDNDQSEAIISDSTSENPNPSRHDQEAEKSTGFYLTDLPVISLPEKDQGESEMLLDTASISSPIHIDSLDPNTSLENALNFVIEDSDQLLSNPYIIYKMVPSKSPN